MEIDNPINTQRRLIQKVLLCRIGVCTLRRTRKALIVFSILLNFACRFSAVAVDRINVTDYGATPDDGTDDTAAINSAVAAGTSIYFPPGSYNYTGRITVPANKSYRFYGDGPGVSVILFTGPMAGIYAPTVGTSTLNVDGLTLEALTGSAGTAIYAAFNSGKFRTATIQNVEIRGNAKTAIPRDTGPSESIYPELKTP
jgi:pectate lyase-like protein